MSPAEYFGLLAAIHFARAMSPAASNVFGFVCLGVQLVCVALEVKSW